MVTWDTMSVTVSGYSKESVTAMATCDSRSATVAVLVIQRNTLPLWLRVITGQ